MVPSTLPSGCVTLTMAMIGMILIGDLRFLDQSTTSFVTDTLANYLG